MNMAKSNKKDSRLDLYRQRGKSPMQKKLELTKSPDRKAMYKSVRIKGFRAFDDFEVNDLNKINLFFGPNNSGKTSVLEAIFTHSCGYNIIPFRDIIIMGRQAPIVTGNLDVGERLFSLFKNTDRFPLEFTINASLATGYKSKDYLLRSSFLPSALLSDLDPREFTEKPDHSHDLSLIDESYLIGGTSQKSEQRYSQSTVNGSISLGKWSLNLNGRPKTSELLFPAKDQEIVAPFKLTCLNDILAHRKQGADIRIFSYLKRYDVLDDFTLKMKQAFPEVEKIDHIPHPDGGRGTIYISTSDGQQLPLYTSGDGMRRWFHLLGDMFVYRNAVHCIEEIDSTFHPSAQGYLSRILTEYANEFHNQLFITSHSIEFADNFLNALYGENGIVGTDDDPVRLFTLKKNSERDEIEIWSFTGRDAYEKRQKYELELRG